MSQRELISIIMPTYNSASTVAESIRSVLDQEYSNWELLITDDASKDDTVGVIEGLQKSEPRIKLSQLQNNSGAAVARNESISHASGKYIAFLDADDLWLPDKLEKQVAFMQKHGYDFTFTAYQRFNSAGEKLGIVRAPASVSYNTLLYSNHIGCLTAMFDAKRLGKQYMPLIRKRQDLGLWLQILKKAEKAYYLDEVLALYRVGDASLSSNKSNVAKYQWELYRQVLKFNPLRSAWYFGWYALNGILKHMR